MKGSSSVAERYAQAFFDLALEQDCLEPLEEDLRESARRIEEYEDLRNLLYHPRVRLEDKKEVLQKVMDFCHPLTLNLLCLLVDKGRIVELEGICRYFQELHQAQKNLMSVQVRTARPLPADLEQVLQERLQKLLQKEIQLHTIEDPTIIGGMVLKIGDLQIDGSIARGLDKLKETLSRIQVSQLGVHEG